MDPITREHLTFTFCCRAKVPLMTALREIDKLAKESLQSAVAPGVEQVDIISKAPEPEVHFRRFQ